jgi:hypothetical protein
MSSVASKQGVQGLPSKQGVQGKAILPPHKKPANAEDFLSSLTLIERKLQELAAEKLGSSYFMDKTSAYKKWLALSAGASKSKK